MKKIQHLVILVCMISILGIGQTNGQCYSFVNVSLSAGDNEPAKAEIYPEYLVQGSQNLSNLQVSRDGLIYSDFIEYYCCDIGIHTYYIRYEETPGTFSFCTGELKIEDKLPPAVTQSTIHLALFGNSSVELTADMISTDLYDNCGIASATFSPSVFSNPGIYSVNYTAEDESGNATSGTLEVTVGTIPNMICSNNSDITLDENGQVVITPETVLSTSNQTVANGDYQVSIDGGPFAKSITLDCGSMGDDEIQVTVQEMVSGNSCWGSLVITDHLPPTFSLNGTVYLSLAGINEVELTEEMLARFTNDNCGIASVSLSQSTFSAIGNYPVTYTINDTKGNTTAISLEVIVTEGDINIACNQNLEFELDQNGSVTIDAYDQLEGIIYLNVDYQISVTESPNQSNDFFDEITLDCSYLDNSYYLVVSGGNNMCFSDLSVVDKIAPTPYAISSTVVTMNGAEPYILDPSLIDAGSFDNCEVASMTVSPNTFNQPGIYTVKLRVFDSSGNSDYALTTLEVQQGNGLAIECVEVTTGVMSPWGQVELFAEDFVINNEDFDNFYMSIDPAGPFTESYEFDCSNFQMNLPFYLYIRAEKNGVISTCLTWLKLHDTTIPVAVVDNNIILELINGQATLDPQDVDDGSYDSCSDITFSLGQTLFTNSDLGDNQVTVTVTDESGNVNQAWTIVTVIDGGNGNGCTINDIIFPNDITIDDPNGTVENLSVPNLQSVYNYSYEEVYPYTQLTCDNIAYAYEDLVIHNTGQIKILRTFTAIDWLTTAVISKSQIIKLNLDNNAALACLENLYVSIEDGPVQLFAQDVLAGNHNGNGVTLVITTSNNITVTDNIITSNYSGQELNYIVTAANGNSCFGTITVGESNNGCPLEDDDISFPLESISLPNTNLASSEYSPEKLVENFGFAEENVNIVITSDCAVAAISYSDEVFNFTDGNYKIVREFVAIDWFTYDPGSANGIWRFVQTINIGINPHEFICDVLPNSAPVGDCDTGHSSDDDVEWPSDLSIADYRITPEGLTEFSNINPINASPKFFNTPNNYEATYIDILISLTSSEITLARVWKATNTVYDVSWNYSQTIVIDFSSFENLVTVNTGTNRSMPGVMINGTIETNDQGEAQVESDILSIAFEDSPTNGINVKDLILTQLYILGFTQLNENEILAADVSLDNKLTATDLVKLRENILGINNDNTWSFIDLNEGPVGPKAQYLAIKRGDIDDSALLPGDTPIQPESEFFIEDILLNNGESYTIPVTIKNITNLLGAELRIGIDEELITLDNIVFPDGFINTHQHISSDGELVVLMQDVLDVNISQNGVKAIAYLEITANANSILSNALTINDKISYIVDEDINLIPLRGSYEDPIGTGTNSPELESITAYPNPTTDYLKINTRNVTVEGQMTLSVYNLHGQKLMSQQGNDILEVSTLSGGTYYYKVEIGTHQTVGKFIVVK